MTQGNGTTAAAGTAAQEAFVEQFAAGWAGGADGFLDHFLPGLVDEQVVLAQPLLPPARGHDGFRAFFEPLFAAIPDLRGGGARLEPRAGRRHDRARAARDARRPAARPPHPRPDRAARRPHPRAPRADGRARRCWSRRCAARASGDPAADRTARAAVGRRERRARSRSRRACARAHRARGSPAASLRAGWPTRSVPAR